MGATDIRIEFKDCHAWFHLTSTCGIDTGPALDKGATIRCAPSEPLDTCDPVNIASSVDTGDEVRLVSTLRPDRQSNLFGVAEATDFAAAGIEPTARLCVLSHEPYN